ncbi:MAG TPA: lysophospholipid acyltransferase family protein [Rhizomicrobium sp.]|jgi:KDO2-lipid IV(A) lauroyltransferase|nr:lysophospholipid acyltransferase family protein [Rhizomicrobium sp.]
MSEALSRPGAGLSLGDRLRYGAEAAVFFAFMALFRVIGLSAASRLGGFIGRNIFCWLPPDKVARANLARAFPEKPLAERDAIRRTMWDNLGRVVGEYPHLDAFSPKGEDPRVTYSLPAGMTVEDLKHRPVMFLSGHLGNWEVMPILAAQVGLDGAAVVRPPNNPFVADWVARQRAINGPSTMIAKHNAARGMLAQLRAGKMLCMLMDQKLREGIAVPFFGHDAMTTPAPAALALKTGARIVLAANRRLPGPRFHVTVYEPPAFAPSGDDAQDTKALTAAFTAGIEEIVRADPGQWLWIHNRWPTARDAELMRDNA